MTSTTVDVASAASVRILSANASRRLAASVALVAATFVQVPGRIVADTKLDLTANPLGLLGRAWNLWDPLSASGSLQNQAYGYFFPMGPFFALGHLLALPAWVVQRLWWALLLLVAFHGLDRLARALGIGTANGRLIAALAFALSPRIVSELGAISAEAWPMAVAPWILIPLVRGSRFGSERRAAALSGVAVLCLGGVNAAASLAALVLPAWWLVTRAPGPRRRRLTSWWLVSVVLATTWWVLPLLVLGKYSPPFLDWIESAAVTTAPASLANGIRGVTHWVPYLAGSTGPSWPAGWSLVTEPILILDTALIAALGAAGLARRDIAHRRFLVGGAVIGLLLLTVWHVGEVASPLASTFQPLLDGVLAPFRNVHKFDPILRIPLALGLVHLVSTVRLVPIRGLPRTRALIPIVASVAVVGAAAPLLGGMVAPRGSFLEVPGYWSETASWLEQHADGRALVLPGMNGVATYWGDPKDDPLQPYVGTPWAVRDGVPLSSAGNIRVLDAVERRIATGYGGPGLAAFLARAGISHVVLRSDADWPRVGAPRPLVIDTALRASPGFRLAAQIGPVLGSDPKDSQHFIDDGLDRPISAVEVFEVQPFEGLVGRTALAAVPRVSGGPEALLGLADRGLVALGPTVLAADDPQRLAGGSEWLTDSYRRREVNFGLVRDNVSETMTEQQAFRAPRPVHDYLPIDPTGRQTVADYTASDPDGGLTDVVLTTSSSGANVGAARNRSPANGAFAALDGDEETAWRSSSLSGAIGEWIELGFGQPQPVSPVRVRFAHDEQSASVLRVRVTTDAGSVDADVAPDDSGYTTITVPEEPTSSVRVAILAVQRPEAHLTLGIADLRLGELDVHRTLVTPERGDYNVIDLSVPDDAHTGCLAAAPPICSSSLPRVGEEDASLDRRVDLDIAGSWEIEVWSRPRSGAALDQLLAPVGQAIAASSSSQLVEDPLVRPQAAVDGSLSTSWVASADDEMPTLTLAWSGGRAVGDVRLEVADGLAASRATRVDVTYSDGTTVEAAVSEDGTVALPVRRTTSVTIRFLETDRRTSTNPTNARTTILPVGVSEVVAPALDSLRRDVPATASTGLACGFGPDVFVDGTRHLTQVTARVEDLLLGRPVRVTVCDTTQLSLGAGPHWIVLAASAETRPSSVTLTRVQPSAARAGDEPAVVVGWTSERRTVEVTAASEDTLLVVHENVNAGWHATIGDQELEPLRVDGWQQGYVVPAGVGGTVELTFRPGGPYQVGLLVGLAGALFLVGLAARPGRSSLPAVGRRRELPGVQLAVGGVALVTLGGWVGLVVGVAVLAARGLWRPWGGSGPLVAGCALAGAGAVAAASPWPSAQSGAQSATAQVLTLLGLAAVLLLVPARGARGREP